MCVAPGSGSRGSSIRRGRPPGLVTPSAAGASSAIAPGGRSPDTAAIRLGGRFGREVTLIAITGKRFLKGANLLAPRTALYLHVEVDGEDVDMLQPLVPDPAAIDLLRAQPSGFALAEAAGALQGRDRPASAIGFAAEIAARLQEPYLTRPGKASVRRSGARGLSVVIPAEDEPVAAAAWNTGLKLARWLHARADADGAARIASEHASFIATARRAAPDMLTIAIARSARQLGIPVYKLPLPGARLQLGEGIHRKLAFETMLEPTDHFGQLLSRDKESTVRWLAYQGVPVLRSERVSGEDDAVAAAARIGGAVVLKPVNAGKGRGVTVNVTAEDDIRQAYYRAAAGGREVMVEAFARGDDHRLLVVSGTMIAAAKRLAAHVTGDGKCTVAALIDRLNADPRRGGPYEKLLERVTVGPALRDQLARQSLSLDSVPPEGAVVWLTLAANISQGGTAVDVTGIVHPDNRAVAERAAAFVGMDVAGVDFISTDISRSWRDVGGWVLELNAPPGLRPHWIANPDHDVVTPIVRRSFPPGARSRIPTAGVTGSMGKTTTCQMLARITAEAGFKTGLCTSQGVWSGGYRVATGDSAGGGMALRLLADPTVEAGVFEFARGALLKHGMTTEGVDVAAVLNVGDNHVGMDGIGTRAQLAAVKAVLARSARRWLFLNADDELVLGMRELTRARVALVAREPANLEIEAHRRGGGRTVTLDDGVIRVADGDAAVFALTVSAIPAALDGRAGAIVSNAMFAAGMAIAMGMPSAAIERALSAFASDPVQNPGRHNRIEGLPFAMLLQWLDGEVSMRGLIDTLAGETVPGRRLLLLSAPGNRSDDWLRALGRAAGGAFDRYYFSDFPELRGRRPGEVGEVIAEGLRAAGVPEDAIVNEPDRRTITAMMEDGRPGDLLVAIDYASHKALAEIERFRARGKAAS